MKKPLKYLGIAITSAGAVLAGLFFLGKRRKEKKRLENKDEDPDEKTELENVPKTNE